MHQSELSSKIEEIETLIQKNEELNSENDKLKVDIEESNKKQSDLVKSLTET
jgi:cell division protein FtsB